VPCYTIVVSVDERGHFMARALEVETSFASGRTQEESIVNLRDSLLTLIASMIEDGEDPPVPASVMKRDEQINIRLTALERLRLEQAARAHGYRGLSDFVRIAALKAAS
jgi:predicted RNase H-like HicB family nuclease